MEYLDFDLVIGPGDGGKYPVHVVHSPNGEAYELIVFKLTGDQLQRHLDKLKIVLMRSYNARGRALDQELQSVQNMGQTFFESIFTGNVRNCYVASLEKAGIEHKGLRMRLHILAPELATLPWEYLYDPQRCEFLSLSSHTPIVRYLELNKTVLPLTVEPPLRVLGIVSSPKNLPSLDVNLEKARVEEAVQELQSKGLVELIWMEGSTWRDLQRILRRESWHILHYIGHGGFDQTNGEGYLMLTDTNGAAQSIYATELARLLSDHEELRLVLLNSCEGAYADQHDIFSSTGATLVRRGVVNVLAMQFPISDRSAIELARAFYEALADGLPVDSAVSEARKAVSIAQINTAEWGTPVLFMRSSDGQLFDIHQDQGNKLTAVARPAMPGTRLTASHWENRLPSILYSLLMIGLVIMALVLAKSYLFPQVFPRVEPTRQISTPTIPKTPVEIRFIDQKLNIRAGDQFGSSTAIDGKIFVVGAPMKDDKGKGAGAVYILEQLDDDWTLLQKLEPEDLRPEDAFGSSVSINGSTIIVGAPNQDNSGSNTGAVYIYYSSDRRKWALQEKLVPSNPETDLHFGGWVKLDKDTALINASDQGKNGNEGSVQVYERKDGIWAFRATLKPHDPQQNHSFGTGDIMGDVAVICAIQDGPDEYGAAYVFVRSNGEWSEQQKIVPSDASSGYQYFCASASISGDTLVVGATLHDDLGQDSGAAYIYVRNESVWIMQKKLTAFDGAANDLFGARVVLDGDMVFIGSPQDDERGENSGSLYRFQRRGTDWIGIDKILIDDSRLGNLLGYTFSISEGTILLGSPFDDGKGFKSGAVYLMIMNSKIPGRETVQKIQ